MNELNKEAIRSEACGLTPRHPLRPLPLHVRQLHRL